MSESSFWKGVGSTVLAAAIVGVATWVYQSSGYARPKLSWGMVSVSEIPEQFLKEEVPFGARRISILRIQNEGSVPANEIELLLDSLPSFLSVPEQLEYRFEEAANGDRHWLYLRGIQGDEEYDITFIGLAKFNIHAVRHSGEDIKEHFGGPEFVSSSDFRLSPWVFFAWLGLTLVLLQISASAVLSETSSKPSKKNEDGSVDDKDKPEEVE